MGLLELRIYVTTNPRSERPHGARALAAQNNWCLAAAAGTCGAIGLLVMLIKTQDNLQFITGTYCAVLGGQSPRHSAGAYWRSPQRPQRGGAPAGLRITIGPPPL